MNSKQSERFAAMSMAARESLSVYALMVDPKYRANRFHRHLARVIEQAVADGQGRIIVQAPPQHGKSELVSRKAPAWILGRHPDWPVMAASYGDDLVELNGGAVRAAVASPMHRAIFPGCALESGSQAKRDFRTTAGGNYLGVTIRGGGTGFPAKCLPAGTMVLTAHGCRAIEALRPGDEVLSCTRHGALVHRKIMATASRFDHEIFRIRTAAGRMVEATGEHPFFTGGGYTPARDLAAGDSLLCAVPQALREEGVRVPQVGGPGAQGELLFEALHGGGVGQAVRGVCGGVAQEELVLLPGVQAAAPQEAGQASAFSGFLRHLQSAFHGAASWGRALCRVLFGGLCRSGPFLADVGAGQSEVEGWGNARADAASCRTGLSGDAAQDRGARWEPVCGVHGKGCTACASHRWLACEQSGIESGDAVSGVPSQGACGHGFRTALDAVVAVDRVRQQTLVFDLQVQETENFFANGVLVHNCLIVDDPFKSRAEADSAVFRAHVQDWYRSVVYPRLAEHSILIVMHTRWHEDDLAGWLLREHAHENWTVVNLPALAEPGDLLGRKPGEALVPERFSVAALDRKRLAVGSREWLALYQGRPPSEGGGVFRMEWLRHYEGQDVSRAMWAMNRYLLVDPARTQKRSSDFTAALVVGLHVDENFYLLDAVYDRLTLRERAQAVIELHRKWRPLATGYKKTGHEQDIEYLAEAQGRENYRFAVQALAESGPKQARIERLAPDFEAGRWWLPQTLWKTDREGVSRDVVSQFVQEEFKPFPAGRHDDFLDCLSGIKDVGAKWPRLKDGARRRGPPEVLIV